MTISYPDTKLFIHDEWVDAEDGGTTPVDNPATGAVIGRVAAATHGDLDRALASVDAGFTTWSAMPPADRARIMRRAAELVRDRAESIAAMMTLEQGKPLAEALAETRAAADIVEWFADEGLRVYGRLVPSRVDSTIRQMVVKDPVGPVAAFAPWNFPINQVVRKLASALGAGCSILIKAPDETPASPAALVRAFQDAGLPAGVIALVYGDAPAISRYVIPHPVIRKLTFTGSTAVGKQLAALAGAHMKRVSMELGGHAPVIVCDDADLDAAVSIMTAAKFRNAGQVCVSPTRFLVQEGVREEFTERMVQTASGLAIGDGFDEGTQMGPLAHPRRITAMAAMIDDALERGATAATGGAQVDREGYFWQPTVLTDVPLDARVLNDEPFGPIAAVRGFVELDEAIAEANRLSYGLAGYAFTTSLANADQISRRVQVGMMWINMPSTPSAELPFGGLGDSGYGTEGGPEAMECYLNTRTIGIRN
ncbi:NAD-dependent succinate-semialdehyde dehydrogenase [Cnuibacter physcomitrellae]|uniref:NAD-dependent succinate-semialdehyde dehydrogenase n=1 Tax=Cnuibacter physcomitrellae TaxID=1619308 RepID=UPI0021759CC7|nr:NAD-dependent succinate-semialdehyde dehydrogenase [Cnuibacter physcomitrellae]MCS5498237.1 NAD-dependent succinate-semialdehyde dehydrogenase [Cnuibacter physcomitrellae]